MIRLASLEDLNAVVAIAVAAYSIYVPQARTDGPKFRRGAAFESPMGV